MLLRNLVGSAARATGRIAPQASSSSTRIPRRLYSEDSQKPGLDDLLGGRRASQSTSTPVRNPFATSLTEEQERALDDLTGRGSAGSEPLSVLDDILSLTAEEKQRRAEAAAAAATAEKPKPAFPKPQPKPKPYRIPTRTVEHAYDDSEDEGPPLGPEGTEIQRPASLASPISRVQTEKNMLSPTAVAYRFYVQANKGNCIMTLINEKGQVRANVSSGLCGFKNSQEGSYEAGYQCAVRMFDKVRAEMNLRKMDMQLEILLKGFGQGRLALIKALTMTEGNGVRELVNRITDRTPIKIGGVRAQKKRRL